MRVFILPRNLTATNPSLDPHLSWHTNQGRSRPTVPTRWLFTSRLFARLVLRQSEP